MLRYYFKDYNMSNMFNMQYLLNTSNVFYINIRYLLTIRIVYVFNNQP